MQIKCALINLLSQAALIRNPYMLTVKAAYYTPFFTFLIRQWHLVAKVIITATNEEVRRSSTKSREGSRSGEHCSCPAWQQTSMLSYFNWSTCMRYRYICNHSYISDSNLRQTTMFFWTCNCAVLENGDICCLEVAGDQFLRSGVSEIKVDLRDNAGDILYPSYFHEVIWSVASVVKAC